MTRIRHNPKLSPADRAHILVLKQEVRRRRLERLIEREMMARSEIVECMEGEAYFKPDVLHSKGDQWECTELMCVNASRSPSRICYTLPTTAYDQKRCGLYADPERRAARSKSRLT